MNLRVSSDFASFGGADGKALGCPNSRAPGIADDQASSFLDSRSSGVDWRSSKLPRIAPSDFAKFEDLSCPKPFSPGHRLIEFSGCPELSTLQRCRLISFLSRPKIFDRSAVPSLHFRVAPNLLYGWVDDEFPPVLEPCILWQSQRMNLQFQSSLAASCLTLDAFLISI